MPKKTTDSEPASKSRLHEIRHKLTAKQKQLLNLFWNSFQQSGEWPQTRIIHSRHHGKEKVRECLRGFGGDVVFENENHSPGHAYQLAFVGILLTDDADNYVKLISQYLEFLRRQYQNQPERLDFTDKEILTDLNLKKEQADFLGSPSPNCCASIALTCCSTWFSTGTRNRGLPSHAASLTDSKPAVQTTFRHSAIICKNFSPSSR